MRLYELQGSSDAVCGGVNGDREKKGVCKHTPPAYRTAVSFRDGVTYSRASKRLLLYMTYLPLQLPQQQ